MKAVGGPMSGYVVLSLGQSCFIVELCETCEQLVSGSAISCLVLSLPSSAVEGK